VNRDFILSLNKDLAYHEFQLWSAIQKAMDATLEARKPGAEEAKRDEKKMLQQQARQWDFHLEQVCTLLGGREELHKKWRRAIEIRHPTFVDEKPTPVPAFWAR
jgi:hypothetical protein